MHRGQTRPVPSPDPRSAVFVESFNANRGIRTLKEKLTATTASVLIAQETGVADSDHDDFAAWAGRRGWKCRASPGQAGKGTTPSKGVAILVRDHIGLRGPDIGDAIVNKRRALHAVVQFPGWPQLHVFGFYLVVGTGVRGRNARILADIGARVADISLPVLLAGDWNAAPREVEESGFPREAKLVLVAPSPPTCITPTSSRSFSAPCVLSATSTSCGPSASARSPMRCAPSTRRRSWSRMRSWIDWVTGRSRRSCACRTSRPRGRSV